MFRRSYITNFMSLLLCRFYFRYQYHITYIGIGKCMQICKLKFPIQKCNKYGKTHKNVVQHLHKWKSNILNQYWNHASLGNISTPHFKCQCQFLTYEMEVFIFNYLNWNHFDGISAPWLKFSRGWILCLLVEQHIWKP